jgi:hypothetical protein
MDIRKIAAAAGFACGAALAFAPFASADTSSDSWSWIDGLLAGASPAEPPVSDFQISFNGMDLFPTAGNEASATTVAGQFGLAIAFGDGAKATAEGGIGNYALADGTNALANAGSTTEGASNFNYNSAVDIGNNVDHTTYIGAPDGAYAGGGSLIGNTDAEGSLGSSHNTAIDIGNNGVDAEGLNDGGNSGAFAGDSGLIGYGHVAGNGDTAYTAGDINGFGDGSAAVAGNNDYASTSGAETGQNEGAFSGFGDNNSAIADTTYTHDFDGVSATFGNGNYAYVFGPNNSTADAGGTADHLGNNNIAYVSDPFSGATSAADHAAAGSTLGASGNNDLAEVLLTHGTATAQGGNFLYDIVSLFGNASGAAASTAAVDPAAAGPAIANPLAGTVNSEVASMNSLFQTEAFLAGVPSTDYSVGPQGFDIINAADIAKDAPATAPFTPLDYELFGVNPGAAGVASDPGAFSEFNGALVNFDDAYNVELFSLLNPNVPVDTIPLADLFGSSSSIAEALATGSATNVVTDFLTDGWNDLLGYFGVFTF